MERNADKTLECDLLPALCGDAEKDSASGKKQQSVSLQDFTIPMSQDDRCVPETISGDSCRAAPHDRQMKYAAH